MMMAGLVGNPQMISCTILALTKLVHDYKGTVVVHWYTLWDVLFVGDQKHAAGSASFCIGRHCFGSEKAFFENGK